MDATIEVIDGDADARSQAGVDTPMENDETAQIPTEQNSDSNSDSDSEESEEEETPTEWLATSRQKRSTAGNRLNVLLQQAQTEEDPEDELNLLFAEDEDGHEDGGFSDHAGHDSDVQMDSSSDSENSGAEDELEGEKALQKQEKEERRQKKRKMKDNIPIFRKRVKIDPTAITRGSGAAAAGAGAPRPKKKSERASWIPAVEDLPTRASRRETTMQSKELLHAQMVDRELKRLKVVRNMEKAQAAKEAKKRPAMTQADRLAEAARIEKQNTKSLSRWEESELLREEEQRAKLAALKNRTLDGPVLTWWSGMAEWFGGRLRQVGKNLTIEEPKEKGASKKRKASEMEDEKEKGSENEKGSEKENGKEKEKETDKNEGPVSDDKTGKSDASVANSESQGAVDASTTNVGDKTTNKEASDAIVDATPKPDSSTTAREIDGPSGTGDKSEKQSSPDVNVEDQSTVGDNTEKAAVLPVDAGDKSKADVPDTNSRVIEEPVKDVTSTIISEPRPSQAEKAPSPVREKSPTPDEDLRLPPILPLQQPLPPRSSVLAPPPGLPIQAPHPPPNFYHHSQNLPPYLLTPPTLDGSAPLPGLGFGYNFHTPSPRSGLGQFAPPYPTQTPLLPPPNTTKPPPSQHPPPFGFPLGQHHYHQHSQTLPLPRTSPQFPGQAPSLAKPQHYQPGIPFSTPQPPPPTPLVQEVKPDSPPRLERSTRNYLILQNFDETAIKDKNVQMEVIFGRKFQKLPSTRSKISHPLCPLTSLPARYRDPTTGLPYANSFAFSELKKLQRGEYKWSALLGAYVGLGTGLVSEAGIGGVAARGVPLRFRDPTAKRETEKVVPGVVSGAAAGNVGGGVTTAAAGVGGGAAEGSRPGSGGGVSLGQALRQGASAGGSGNGSAAPTQPVVAAASGSVQAQGNAKI